jgi:hypothetical protein
MAQAVWQLTCLQTHVENMHKVGAQCVLLDQHATWGARVEAQQLDVLSTHAMHIFYPAHTQLV